MAHGGSYHYGGMSVQERFALIAAQQWENSKYRRTPNHKLIGVREADLQHLDQSSDGTAESGMAETTFDTTTDTSAAHILLTNSSGSTIVLESVVIKAKPVYQVSGDAGYINEDYRDDEDIARSGVKFVKFANDNINSVAHLDSVSEWVWKNLSTMRHTYSCSLRGSWAELQLGARYKLTIGTAGLAEYINSIVRCSRIVEQVGRSGITTTVTFYEIEEAFKLDSNTTSRFYASGKLPDGVTLDRVVVGAKFYAGPAMAYCDGTADEVQINAAIDFMSSVMGGGIVHLTAGKFIVTAGIEMKAGVTLEGEGKSTVIEKNVDDDAISALGGSGTEMVGVTIRSLRITRNGSDTNANQDLLRFVFCDDLVLQDLWLDNSYAYAIDMTSCDNGLIDGVSVLGWGSFAATNIANCDDLRMNNVIVDGAGQTSRHGMQFSVTAANFNCSNILVKNFVSTGGAAVGFKIAGDNGRVTNVKVRDFATTSGASVMKGLEITGDGNQISSIEADNIDNSGTAANAHGIYITGDDNVITSFLAHNCSGTGVITDASADKTMLSGGRSTGNGTNYTNGGSGTIVSSFDFA